MPLPPTSEEIARLKRVLLRKGAEINEKLTALLAGQKPALSGLPPVTRPGETPEERLRRFLALVDGRLRAIAAGRYGRCERCGDGLPVTDLEQIPWLDTCRACAAQPDH
jgi:hypothetical protein